MSLFGKLDAETIKSNPFFIEKGEYEAEVTDAKYKAGRDGGRQLVIDFVIEDETSQYDGKRASKFFDLVDSEMTFEAFALLPPEEKATISRNLSSTKNMLCGNGRNKGLGVAADDLNDKDWDPAVLKGVKVIMSISNFGDDGVNVRWANLRD